jgi:hypothetical protein
MDSMLLFSESDAVPVDSIHYDPAPAQAAEPQKPRHCYRCEDCLTVCFADGDQLPSAKCGACDGRMEHMGRVERGRLKEDTYACPCDARCTSARGPNCDCLCGGKNHGSNAVVEVTRDFRPRARYADTEP